MHVKLKNAIQQFSDFQKLITVEPYGSGHINDTFKVSRLENGNPEPYLLQQLNRHVFKQPEAVMHNIRLVAEHLAMQDYPLEILRPLPTRSGTFIWRDETGGCWRAFPFFNKTTTFDNVETEAQAFKAAEAFGAFAKALDSMNVQALHLTIPGFHDGMGRLAYFRQVLGRAKPDRLRKAKQEVAEVLQNESLFKKIASLDLPLRAAHHDTKINNVLFDSQTGQAVCVIDLDTVMPGTVLSDFGDMMRTFTNAAGEDEPDLSKVGMRLPIFHALREGFLSQTGSLLAPAELANLTEGGRWLTLMQAMRFLGDYLEGDVYYKTKYPAHNLVRARNQLALFRSMGG
jgi:Ser/Thr protein kinase RdoA (MazF antagonist)